MNPQELAERVINIHTTKPFKYVVDIVLDESKCGKRKQVLFWKSQDRDDGTISTHFFIEFENKASVSAAQQAAAQFQGVTVHCLSRNMNMMPIFDCLSKGIDPPRKRPLAETERDAIAPAAIASLPDRPRDPVALRNVNSQVPLGPSASKKQRIHDNNGTVPPPPTAATLREQPPPRPIPPYRQPRPLPPHPPHEDAQQKLPLKPSNLTWKQASYAADHRRAQTENEENQNNRFHDRTNTSVSRSPTHRIPYEYDERLQEPPQPKIDIDSRETRMRRQSDASHQSSASFNNGRTPSIRRASPMAHASPNITQFTDDMKLGYTTKLPDLENLEESDVASVIDMLMQSSMGPEAWMTVAAAFRRKLMHRAALAVIGAMLEVMAKRGMEKSDLRPALLLMAQCHYSIAKEEGKMTGDEREASNKYFVTLLDWLRQTYGPNTPAVSAIARAQMQSARNGTTGSDLKPFSPSDIPGLSNDSPFPSSLSTPLAVVEAATARYKAVTEQLAQLRKEMVALERETDRAREARVEAEAALREETSKRRRAEQEVRDVRADERTQLARVQREADARKDAEERLTQERQLAQRHTVEAKDDAARAVVQDLAKILTFASRAPVSTLDSLRAFCETRARGERLPPVPP